MVVVVVDAESRGDGEDVREDAVVAED